MVYDPIYYRCNCHRSQVTLNPSLANYRAPPCQQFVLTVLPVECWNNPIKQPTDINPSVHHGASYVHLLPRLTKSMHAKIDHAHKKGFVRRPGILQMACLNGENYGTPSIWGYHHHHLDKSTNQIIITFIHQILTRKKQIKSLSSTPGMGDKTKSL